MEPSKNWIAHPNQSEWWILVGGLIFSALLRIVRLQDRGLWYDDAFSVFLARRPLPSIVAGTAADTMPPLYYLVLHYWLKISHQVWFIRSVNVVISLGIVVVVYLFVSRLFDVRSGLWAMILVAISPMQIYHAQEIRMYVILALALLAHYVFFHQSLQSGKPPSRLWLLRFGMVVSGVVAMYSHNLAVFSLVAANIYLTLKRRWRDLAWLLVVQGTIGLLSVPWLVLIPGQIQKIQTAFWTPRPGLVEILQAIVMFHANLPLPGMLLSIAVFTSLMAMTLVGYETIKSGAWRQDRTQLLIVMFLVPPLFMWIGSYLMRPIFVPRAFLLSSLAYTGVASQAISQARHRWIGWLILGLFIVSSLVTLPYQYLFDTFPRSPFQEAALKLRSSIHDGDVIVHDNKLSYFPMHYYAPELPQVFLPDEPGSHNDTLAPATQKAMQIYPEADIQQKVEGSGRIWFIVFDRAIEEYRMNGVDNHPQLDWFEARYGNHEKIQINDLQLHLFTP